MNKLEKLAGSNKEKISEMWFETLLASYPKDKTRFFATQKDLFLNPVGVSIEESIKKTLEEILKKNPDMDKLSEFMDPIIRIAAVQNDFGPAKATAFVFSLKEILRKEFKREVKDFYQCLDEFSKKLDRLALLSFEIFMECREKIFDLKARHVKERTLNILKSKDVFAEVEEVGTEIISHEVFKKGGFEQQ